jgi:hypothetical protein
LTYRSNWMLYLHSQLIQSLHLHLNAACIVEKQEILILLSDRGSN